MQHAEHNVLYAQDPLMQGFHARHISHMLDIVCENQGQTGFSVAEIGAGTGGFTRQVSSRSRALQSCPPTIMLVCDSAITFYCRHVESLLTALSFAGHC